MSVKPVPDGYTTITPYLIVKDVAGLLPFVEQAFGATITHATRLKDGTVMHCDVVIGNAHVMFGEAHGEYAPMPTMLYVYVEDCDAVYARALAAGGVSVQEPTLAFYGDRNCGVRDRAGNQWWIATHVKDVSPEEIERMHAERC